MNDVARLLRQAVARHQAGDLAGAGAGYQAVLAIAPNQADALHLLGVVKDEQGDHDGAVEFIRRAIAASPDTADFHGNLGTALNAAGQPEAAISAYRRAMALDPHNAEWPYNLGNLLRTAGDPQAAADQFRCALRLRPGHLMAGNNLAMLLWEDLDDVAGAEAQFRDLIERAPEWPLGRMNHGLFCLSRGRYAEGWREYEWRWRYDGYREKDWGLGLPRWRGQPLGGAGLLLWGEQGPGDQILHGTMLADMARRVEAKIIVAVEARLVPLFERSLAGRGIRVVQRGAMADGAVAQCPFGSLGTFVRCDDTDFAGGAPYLQADPERTACLRERYRALARPGQKVIGLSWRSGNPSIGREKSLPLPILAPVLQTLDAQWVSLQYGDTVADRRWLAAAGVSLHHDPEIDGMQDLDGFAAQVASLDAVVSVSNTAAHMAGALGRPCLLLLPAGRGRLWYWPATGGTTPWYDSLRILRQPAPGDWEGAVASLRSSLSALL